MFDKMKEYIDS
jgi:hypothetical protein